MKQEVATLSLLLTPGSLHINNKCQDLRSSSRAIKFVTQFNLGY